MDYVILLGAGASFGSMKVSPYPPPLGKKLFDDLVSLNKTAARLPNDLKNIFRSDFELGMAEYFSRYNKNTASFQRELAGYLASFSPEKGNTYIHMLSVLKGRKIIYSSLNYDLLFEISASFQKKGVTYSNIEKENHIRLLKIHGSSNFWPDHGGFIFRNVHFSDNRIDDSSTVKPLSQKQTLEKCMTEDSIAPSMALFAKGKEVRISPQFVHQQYRMWLDSVNKAKKIFISGVRVHEIDEHIWGVLSKTTAEIHYFGFNPDKVEFDEWKKKCKSGNQFFHFLSFDQAIDKIRKLTR